MDAKKILKDLQYRIDTAPDTDPEKENAIRLRDRLLAKNGLRLEDITEVRTERTFDKLTREESSMVCQYFRKKMKIKFDEAPYFLNSYQYRKKKTKFRNFVQISLTDDECLQHWKAVESLVAIHRRKMRELEKQLKREAEAKRRALEYAIYEKADILFPAGWNGDESKESSCYRAIDRHFGNEIRAQLEKNLVNYPKETKELLKLCKKACERIAKEVA